MVEAVERAGHRCELFLYDRYGGDVRAHERVIRDWWPNIRAGVHDASAGISGVDACVASSWDTAHVLARRGTSPMRRLYFIQDFEPYFYPRGSMYSLAEDTYRFGFRCIALGEMVAQLLRSEVGISPDVTEFGCDTSVYRLLPDRERTGRGAVRAPRRAPSRLLAGAPRAAAVPRAAPRGRHPPVRIRGQRDSRSRPTQHGRLTPAELNELYNSSIAGLAMSFTNISLVAEEMLAAGTIPVVNDSVHSRADLVNDHVAWATPTPHGIAAALSAVVTRADRGRRGAGGVRVGPAVRLEQGPGRRRADPRGRGVRIVTPVEQEPQTPERQLSRPSVRRPRRACSG